MGDVTEKWESLYEEVCEANDELCARLALAQAVIEAAERLKWDNVISTLNAFDLFLEKFSVPEDDRLTAEMKRISAKTAASAPEDMMQTRIQELSAALATYRAATNAEGIGEVGEG